MTDDELESELSSRGASCLLTTIPGRELRHVCAVRNDTDHGFAMHQDSDSAIRLALAELDLKARNRRAQEVTARMKVVPGGRMLF